MAMDYFRILGGPVVQWMENKIWRPQRRLSGTPQQHELGEVV